MLSDVKGTGSCIRTVLLPFLLCARWSRPSMDALSRSQGASFERAFHTGLWESVATNDAECL